MPWQNGPLMLYHGTDESSANDIINSGVKLALCKALTDFGQGFYLTTYLHQAKNWANVRCRLLQKKHHLPIPPIATVILFEISREDLTTTTKPEVLVFITEGSNPDYWDLVAHCRQGGSRTSGHRLRKTQYYNMVYGPVSLWPQTLVIKDCDQISFHTCKSQSLLTQLKPDKVYAQGNPLF
jgi:hypothetical protein